MSLTARASAAYDKKMEGKNARSEEKVKEAMDFQVRLVQHSMKEVLGVEGITAEDVQYDDLGIFSQNPEPELVLEGMCFRIGRYSDHSVKYLARCNSCPSDRKPASVVATPIRCVTDLGAALAEGVKCLKCQKEEAKEEADPPLDLDELRELAHAGTKSRDPLLLTMLYLAESIRNNGDGITIFLDAIAQGFGIQPPQPSPGYKDGDPFEETPGK